MKDTKFYRFIPAERSCWDRECKRNTVIFNSKLLMGAQTFPKSCISLKMRKCRKRTVQINVRKCEPFPIEYRRLLTKMIHALIFSLFNPFSPDANLSFRVLSVSPANNFGLSERLKTFHSVNANIIIIDQGKVIVSSLFVSIRFLFFVIL